MSIRDHPPSPDVSGGFGRALDGSHAAALTPAQVLAELDCGPGGLTNVEATRRREAIGPNLLRGRGARPLNTFVRQLRNPLLVLLIAAAAASWIVGEVTAGAIVLLIIGASIALGFMNEYRAERAVDALHARIRHRALVLRDGQAVLLNVTDLVPGDVVRMSLGDMVPADIRLLAVDGLECDESVLTGEPLPTAKSVEAQASPAFAPVACALMGTVVRRGSGSGVVVATGARTAFGAAAMALGDRPPPTAFAVGLHAYSLLLVRVTALLALAVLIANVALGRPVLEAVLFALAISVGLTPQLLPAIVTVGLSSGARRLASLDVLVKRLMSIEDLGNIGMLLTDKTGTLTEGDITFDAAVSVAGTPSDEVLKLGLACSEVVREGGRPVGGNALDLALWRDAEAARPLGPPAPVAARAFDHDRRISSVIIDERGQRLLIAKGAPEAIMQRCTGLTGAARVVAERLFDDGRRVVAVATRAVGANIDTIGDHEEADLVLAGFLVFLDPPKAGAAEAIARLRALGIGVAVVTGDNPRVAARVCADLGLGVTGILTGDDIDALDERALADAVATTTIFARVSPAQKARVVAACRVSGATVGVLGDGVNDAVALHVADVGISVDTAVDVARDAADIVLLDKDLGVLARGVVEGRRIFANTMKYVLMGTSSNFGNMASAGVGSVALGFLPMLPSQILLNNLLYDAGELSIPSDNVDEEQLRRPAHWDTGTIRRFMLTFGSVSAGFDIMTFAVLLGVFDVGTDLFRSAWFVESLATQGLVIFIIRTRRVPFVRSRPSALLTTATLACVGVGAALPFSPLAGALGFTAIPPHVFGALVVIVAAYLATIELLKRRLLRDGATGPPLSRPRHHVQHRIHLRAMRWSHPRLPNVGPASSATRARQP